jgi:hypothetical protein
LGIGYGRQENIEYINKDLISALSHPCERGMANAWHGFHNKLYENNGAGLFSNLTYAIEWVKCWGGGNIFSQGRYEQIRDLPLGEFCLEEGIKEQPEIQNILGFALRKWQTEGKHKIHKHKI